MSDDKIIQFPTNKIKNYEIEDQVNKKQNDEKYLKKVKEQQTREFVEAVVDDISMHLLRSFVDISMKTDKAYFTKDLAMLVDMLRGMIYRDFGLNHPAQLLSDQIVVLNFNKNGDMSAKIDYSKIIEKSGKSNKPFSNEVKEELKDLKDGSHLFFEPENLDDQ